MSNKRKVSGLAARKLLRIKDENYRLSPKLRGNLHDQTELSADFFRSLNISQLQVNTRNDADRGVIVSLELTLAEPNELLEIVSGEAVITASYYVAEGRRVECANLVSWGTREGLQDSEPLRRQFERIIRSRYPEQRSLTAEDIVCRVAPQGFVDDYPSDPVPPYYCKPEEMIEAVKSWLEASGVESRFYYGLGENGF